MISNAYFPTAARIQGDRGQTVCREGPYRIVRHPGYSGTIFQSIGAPLLLGSAWALLPAVVAIAAISVRTWFEDRMLRAELPGYAEYATAVRRRLVPLIW
jgi:protein-S-isoprenylcysteine O-methyltransferase Ste14